jgi:MFS family permease
VARLVQGAFRALLIPQGFGILGSVFPREHIGKAFSAFGPILGLSAVGGPLLAGLLIDANLFGLGWRPMFLINIVLGVAGLAAGLRLLPRDVGDRAVSIDALPDDAAYVALAETLDCELLTADQHLANASGPRCTIRVLQ